LIRDLGKCQASAKKVPQIFSDDEKQWQLDACAYTACQLAEGNNFFNRVFTCMNHGTSITYYQYH
jgi:hypothetical protein